MPQHSHSASSNNTGSHTHNCSWDWGYGGSDSWNAFGKSYDNTYNRASSRFYMDAAGSHSHTITVNNTGSSMEHNNMQPYIAVHCWRRIQ